MGEQTVLKCEERKKPPGERVSKARCSRWPFEWGEARFDRLTGGPQNGPPSANFQCPPRPFRTTECRLKRRSIVQQSGTPAPGGAHALCQQRGGRGRQPARPTPALISAGPLLNLRCLAARFLRVLFVQHSGPEPDKSGLESGWIGIRIRI